MEDENEKKKEQLEKELKSLQKAQMDLIVENASLRKQIERLMKVVAFLTKGE
jgi:ribosomal protein L29